MAPSRHNCQPLTPEVEQAEKWLTDIQEYIRKNPSVKGFPEDEKQVFEL